MKRRVRPRRGWLFLGGDLTRLWTTHETEVKRGVKMDGWKKAVAAAESWRELDFCEITATFWNQSLSKVLTNLIIPAEN